MMGVRRLFSIPMVAGRGYPYDVSREGQRFLVVVSSGVATTPLARSCWTGMPIFHVDRGFNSGPQSSTSCLTDDRP